MNQRIVINRCYGGFGLSDLATQRYRELAWIPEEELFWTYDIPRDSKILLQVIDELGVEKTSGPHAELKVVEVPEGVKWHIADYDGMEHIAEDHRQWGLDEYPKEEVQEELFPVENKVSIDQIVIDLHNIARRVENNGNPDGIGYSIREIADRLSECKKPGWHMEWVPDSESWYEP